MVGYSGYFNVSIVFDIDRLLTTGHLWLIYKQTK